MNDFYREPTRAELVDRYEKRIHAQRERILELEDKLAKRPLPWWVVGLAGMGAVGSGYLLADLPRGVPGPEMLVLSVMGVGALFAAALRGAR